MESAVWGKWDAPENGASIRDLANFKMDNHS